MTITPETKESMLKVCEIIGRSAVVDCMIVVKRPDNSDQLLVVEQLKQRPAKEI